jgi:hypothetical protein
LKFSIFLICMFLRSKGDLISAFGYAVCIKSKCNFFFNYCYLQFLVIMFIVLLMVNVLFYIHKKICLCLCFRTCFDWFTFV